MLNHFLEIKANDQSIIPVIRDGLEWSQMTATRWDNLGDQAGGHTRCQFVSDPWMMYARNHNINFDLIIPGDWEWRDKWESIFDIHTRHAPSGGQLPCSYHISGDELIASYISAPGVKAVKYRMRLIRDHVYRFRIKTSIAEERWRGYAICEVNGERWYHYTGATSFPGENHETGPVWKVGPYIPGEWAEGINYRRLLIRV